MFFPTHLGFCWNECLNIVLHMQLLGSSVLRGGYIIIMPRLTREPGNVVLSKKEFMLKYRLWLQRGSCFVMLPPEAMTLITEYAAGYWMDRVYLSSTSSFAAKCVLASAAYHNSWLAYENSYYDGLKSIQEYEAELYEAMIHSPGLFGL